MPGKSTIRILYIIARLNIGGPAIHTVTLAENFSQGSYQIVLVCGSVSPYEGDMSYLAASKGIQTTVLPTLGREISFFDDFRSFGELGRIIKDFRPHVIHTHTAKAGTLGRLAGVCRNIRRGSKNRIKLVHTFHGHVFHSYFGSVKTFSFIQIERFLAGFTDRIIVVSPIQQKDICWKYRITRPEKVSIIPLGFDLSDFRDNEKQRESTRRKYFPNASKDILVIGIVGRLTHVKNHRMLLDAAKRLRNRDKDHLFRFLVVGDGELRNTLAGYASELGLEKSVVFTGWQKEMPSIYSALDVVALTSLNEGTPVTLIEAIAAGKPVIATDVGGVRDLLGPVAKMSSDEYELAQNGILVPSEKEEILAKALIFFSENRSLFKRTAKRGQEFVLKHYSTERMVKDHESLYRELVNG